MISADEARQLLQAAEWTEGDPPIDGRRRLFLAAKNLAKTVILQAEQIEEVRVLAKEYSGSRIPADMLLAALGDVQ